ncbi:MAG: hypothetical protein OXH70_10800 [Acidobacteria bacterium]|nr:hypothetical protein [Acidobacteriota bacterium]
MSAKYIYEFVIERGRSSVKHSALADRHEEDDYTIVLYRGEEEAGRYRLDRIIGWSRRPLVRPRIEAL